MLINDLLIFSDEKKKQEMTSDGDVMAPTANCNGEWHYPRHCSPANGSCEYSIQWTYKGRKVISCIIKRNSCIYLLYRLFLYRISYRLLFPLLTRILGPALGSLMTRKWYALTS